MKSYLVVLMIFLMASFVSCEVNERFLDVEKDYVFGQKNEKGRWIKCSEEEPDCTMKIDDPSAACVFRKVIAIGNPRDNEYVNMIKKDPDAEPGRNSTRCMS